jgi:hypothetical protein
LRKISFTEDATVVQMRELINGVRIAVVRNKLILRTDHRTVSWCDLWHAAETLAEAGWQRLSTG